MALDDKDVSVDDNANGQETVTKVDEECKEWKEVTKFQTLNCFEVLLIDNVGNGDDIADTEDGVKHHHPVQEGLGRLVDDEEDQISICQYYQGITN